MPLVFRALSFDTMRNASNCTISFQLRHFDFCRFGQIQCKQVDTSCLAICRANKTRQYYTLDTLTTQCWRFWLADDVSERYSYGFSNCKQQQNRAHTLSLSRTHSNAHMYEQKEFYAARNVSFDFLISSTHSMAIC